MPGLPDAAGGEMAIDDGVDLVGALRRLVDALREAGDGARRWRGTARRSARRRPRRGRMARAVAASIGRDLARARQRLGKAGGVRLDVSRSRARRARRDATSSPQNSAVSVPGAIGRNRSASCAVTVRRGSMTTMRAPRSRLVAHHALEQDRMAPGRVGADQHDQVGQIEIGVAARHGVGAEGAALAGDRGRHAQPRIGVDIGRADEALHQLVGDVIVLGQQLAGEIERDRVGPVALDDRAKSVGRPGRAPTSQLARASLPSACRSIGCSSRPVEPDRLAQRRALRAQPSEIRRMRRDRPRPPRRRVRPAAPAGRSRPRNTGRWCAPSGRAASGRSC